MFNILTDPLIRINVAGNTYPAPLPETYAALMDDKVDSFPALRPHQRHAWHAFLVQLGAMAMHRAGLAEPPRDAEEWLRIIRALTADYPDGEPWHLVVEDITKPAFMQPPASDWTSYDTKTLFWSPDALDMLDTAKNHDLKTVVGRDAEFENWLFALITMQTMNGQVGRGNYPIARMNSGDGSRTAFSVTPSLSPGAHVRRDMTALLERSSEITGSLPFRWDGLGLLWTRQWNGKESEAILLSDLHPFYIEICRRRRLRVDAARRLHALKAASENRRIAAKENRGVVGDPWTLVTVDKGGVKALTMQRDSFDYRHIADYLTSSDWTTPFLFAVTPSEQSVGSIYLIARAIRRKKGGQTEGYHERIVPIRTKARTAMLRRDSNLDALGQIAQDRIEQIRIVQSILRHAITSFATHGDDGRTSTVLRSRPQDNPLRKKVDEWVSKLDEIVDARFFDDLQDEFEVDDETERRRVRNEWLMNGRDGIVDSARRTLHAAEDSLPCPVIHRYRARVNAEGLFEGRIRGAKGLPFLFDTHEGGAE